jgi:hypothetical protein
MTDQIDAAAYAKLKYLRNRPRPFLLHTESVIYRCRRVTGLDDPGPPGASVTVQCQSGETSILLSMIASVKIQDQGHRA